MQYNFVEYYAATCIPERYFGHTHCFPTKTISPAEWETQAHSATYGTVSKERAAEGGRGRGAERKDFFGSQNHFLPLVLFFGEAARASLSLSLSFSFWFMASAEGPSSSFRLRGGDGGGRGAAF